MFTLISEDKMGIFWGHKDIRKQLEDSINLKCKNIQSESDAKKKEEEEWVWVEGFKGMDKDMQCRGFQYEVGKTYVYDGEVKVANSGFHFCGNLAGTLSCYPLDLNNRYFKIRGMVKSIDCDAPNYPHFYNGVYNI